MSISNNSQPEQPDVIYANLSHNNEPTVIESLCVNCEKNGQTTLLMTSIPMFREIIIISFYCNECGYKNSEVQFGGKIKETGCKLSLKLTNPQDLKRECVRSEYATIFIPELDFEMPANKKGRISTIEGFITSSIDDLQAEQEERRKIQPEIAQQIDQFIQKLQLLVDGQSFPFHFKINDPSGNSFIQNPHAPQIDQQLIIEQYQRTSQQLEVMGFSVENQIINKKSEQNLADKQEDQRNEENKQQKNLDQQDQSVQKNTPIRRLDAHKVDFNKPLASDTKGESLVFNVPCHSCGKQGETKMCTTSIPYFKEIVVMAFTCDYCGARSSEVKVGGEISEKGKKIVLKVQKLEDLKRDLFKSENASIIIPEIELELDYGTLGGVYTTVEGLLEKIQDNLKDNNPFCGDSSEKSFSQKWENLLNQIEDLKQLKYPYTIIIIDLLDNSFIQNPYYPNQDPNVTAELFERNYQQNEELGLNDIKVDNYQNDQK